MQNKSDDELIDYNEEEGKDNGPSQRVSRTPPESPTSLISDNDMADGDTTDENDLEEGQETEMETQSTQITLAEQKQRDFELLTKNLEENAWKLRMKVFSDPNQAYKAIPMATPTRTLAEILQLVPLEDAEQISDFQGLVDMPQQFMEKYFLSTMQMRKLTELEDETSGERELLPGGPETAMMYSLYHQAKHTTSSS
jgi:hypothetical protein